MAAAACLALAARQFARSALAARGGGSGRRPVPDAARQAPLTIPPSLAERFAVGGAGHSASARDRFFADLASRFRLAGFRINPRQPEESRAIIEDRETHRQWMRRRGESLAPAVALHEVETNGVVLSTPYGPCRLALSGRGQEAAAPAARTTPPAPDGLPQASFASDAASRLLGNESSPGTWTFSRSDLMAYYDEVRRRPERLEAVFDTLAPIWFSDEADGRQKIDGYRVEPCGEEVFFAAVGLREGDVIREVNGIRMDNRYAAEELIRRFAAGDLTFAHIKMERDGSEIVQSYFLKDF